MSKGLQNAFLGGPAIALAREAVAANGHTARALELHRDRPFYLEVAGDDRVLSGFGARA